MADVLEIFADTGKTIERAFTHEEQAQRELDIAAYEAAQVAHAAQALAAASARTAAIAHAKSLGFTDEMISVLYPNLLEA